MRETGHLRRVLREELGLSHFGWRLVGAGAALLPRHAAGRTRAVLYRLAGLRIGRGTLLLGRVDLSGDGSPRRCLRIGDNCVLNDGLTFNLGGEVCIGQGVGIGMGCLFITITHEVGDATYRAGRTIHGDIRIGDGAWLGARVTVLPGVTIGAGAIIGAGAVVTRDIPPHTLAAGVPAAVKRSLEAP
jgi:acetyltransferase-like isoleucine patch superfamily enzyme